MKTKIEIKDIFSNVLFTYECEDNSVKKCVVNFAIECVRQAGGSGLELGALGQKIHKKYPNFKVKEYGYSTLSKFIYGIKLLKIDNLDENRKLVFLK